MKYIIVTSFVLLMVCKSQAQYLNLGPVYVGCFADKDARDLSGAPKLSDQTMTNAKCSFHCFTRGYKYAATQYGTECRCGNTYGTYGTSSDCKMNCAGDANTMCGGGLANTITLAGPYMLGCFADKAIRDLSGPSITDNSMTLAKCRLYCYNQGYKYAGAQSSNECYCGNYYGKYGSSEQCAWNCPGEVNAVCGGSWANTVMLSGPVIIGCYADKAARDLSGPSITGDAAMTFAKCSLFCASKGYKYGGIQVGKECYCGNTYGSYGTSTDCNMNCAGDASTVCGGPWANTVILTTLA